VMEEEEVNDDSLLAAVRELYRDRQRYIDAMHAAGQTDAVSMILDLLDEACGNA